MAPFSAVSYSPLPRTLGLNHSLMVGLTNKPDASEMSFKSYGNVAAGQAVVRELPRCAHSSGCP